MRRWALAVAVMACRTGRAPAPPPPDRTPYLAVFERGRAFTLPIEQAAGRQHGEAWPVTHRERGTLTCTVAETKQVGDASVSRVSCAAPHAALLVVGTWVATPAGLYHPALPVDEPDELTLLGEDELLLAAIPAEREHSRAIDNAQDTVEAFPFEASWCVRQTTAAPDLRRSYALCFGRAGVTGGSELVISDGEWQRVRFGAAPPDPDDPTLPHDDD